MPLLNSAILNSNTKNPAFPQLSAQPGLTHCKLSPESLPHLHFLKGTKAGDSPKSPALPSILGVFSSPVLLCPSLQEHLEVPPVPPVPGGGKLGCWNAANPSFLSHQGLEFNLDLLALDCCGCREKGAVQGTPSEQQPEGNLPFFILQLSSE